MTFAHHHDGADGRAWSAQQMRPRVALANLARAIVATGDNVLPPTAPGVTPIGTEAVMMAPVFPQPMYEALKEKSQELLLPGLDKVEPEQRRGAQNESRVRRGLHDRPEFRDGARAPLARIPDRPAGHVLQTFLGHRHGRGPPADIDDLRKNLGRALGTAPPNAPADQFVLLLRSSLLRRYPNAIIYLTPASTARRPAPDIFPIFNGSMDPDVTFVGFPITPAAAIGSATSPGYFLVIQEHPDGAPLRTRCGRHGSAQRARAISRSARSRQSGVPLKGRTWGKNSAHMAEITRRAAGPHHHSRFATRGALTFETVI